MCRSLGIVHKRPDMSQIQRFMNSEFGGLVKMATTYFSKEKFESLPPVVMGLNVLVQYINRTCKVSRVEASRRSSRCNGHAQLGMIATT